MDECSNDSGYDPKLNPESATTMRLCCVDGQLSVAQIGVCPYSWQRLYQEPKDAFAAFIVLHKTPRIPHL